MEKIVKDKICPSCGSSNIVGGYQIYAGGMFKKKFGTTGSPIEHMICSECGLIIESRICDIDMFRKKAIRGSIKQKIVLLYGGNMKKKILINILLLILCTLAICINVFLDHFKGIGIVCILLMGALAVAKDKKNRFK